MKYVKYRTQRGISVVGIKKVDVNDNYPTADLYNVVVHCEMGIQIYIEGDLRHKFLQKFSKYDIIDMSREDRDIQITQIGASDYVQ